MKSLKVSAAVVSFSLALLLPAGSTVTSTS